MKKLAYVFAFLFSFVSLIEAQDLEVKDLWFFGKKGIVSGKLSPAFSQIESEVDGTPGKSEIDNFRVDYEIFYSFTDQLKIGLAPAYSYSKTKGSSKDSGLEEPSLLAQYRFLDATSSPVFLDLALALSPAWGENKTSSTTRGNNKITAGLLVGQSLGAFSYKVNPSASYFTVTHNENAEDTEATFDVGLNIFTQYVLSENFDLVGNLKIAFPGEEKEASSSLNIDYVLIVEPGIQYSIMYEMSLKLLANYIHSQGIVKNALIGTKDITASGFGGRAELSFAF